MFLYNTLQIEKNTFLFSPPDCPTTTCPLNETTKSIPLLYFLHKKKKYNFTDDYM